MDGRTKYAYDDIEEEKDGQQLPDYAVFRGVERKGDSLGVEETKDQDGCSQQRLKFYQHLPGARQALVVHAHEGGGQRRDAHAPEAGHEQLVSGVRELEGEGKERDLRYRDGEKQQQIDRDLFEQSAHYQVGNPGRYAESQYRA